MANCSHACDKIAGYQSSSWHFGSHISFFFQSTLHTSLSTVASNHCFPLHLGFQHSMSQGHPILTPALQQAEVRWGWGGVGNALRPKSFFHFMSQSHEWKISYIIEIEWKERKKKERNRVDCYITLASAGLWKGEGEVTVHRCPTSQHEMGLCNTQTIACLTGFFSWL